MAPIVVIRDLIKEYSGRRALDGVSLEINEGEIFGLIGPNGAGKTTALRVLSTIIKPTSGYAEVCGKDIVKEGSAVRKLISYLPEEAGAYPNLSGYEYLRFMASFYYGNGGEIKAALAEGERISGLGDRMRDKTSTYSKGMRRRLLLARTLMVRPRLAILDEPTSGLDVTHAFHLRNVIKSYSKEHDTTVLLSSHNMLEVEYLCDRVAFINEGRIVEVGSPSGLRARHEAANLEEAFVKVVRVA
ncbi:MAG: ABC transporter ATP-binding protein [Candidatus Verstraetearchaeota archaeon]|nr:ABC transporter ATP-binding protein [Candidatus Verstraetearchaeota archaeon]